MDNLVISQKVREKLKTRHNVSEDEIAECFTNMEGRFLLDDREDNQTNPASEWFVAETYRGRRLKVIFMYYKDTNKIVIKTAYPAEPDAIRIYEKYAID